MSFNRLPIKSGSYVTQKKNVLPQLLRVFHAISAITYFAYMENVSASHAMNMYLIPQLFHAA